MKKLSFKVKKNIITSILVVLVITFGAVIVSSITREHKVKDTEALVKEDKLLDIKIDDTKNNNSSQAKVPVIESNEKIEKLAEDKELNLDTELIKKENKVVKPDPPKDKPKTNDDVTNKNKVPTYPEEEIKPQPEKSKVEETNNKGQLNFPGFGQVDDGGENRGENVNSNGDINKQVGTMD